MKKLRVFQTVVHKRIVSGGSLKNLGTILLLFLIIPYLITFLFGNLREGEDSKTVSASVLDEGDMVGSIYVCNTTVLGNESIPLEIYVADRLARSINENFEMEALKAQAVLIRSGLLAADESGKNQKKIYVEDKEYGKERVSERIWQAVSETMGVCLMWEGKIVSGAYFTVSNGTTRNGEELSLTEYPYLKSVVCERDFLSEDYISYVSYGENEFEKLWQQIPKLSLSEEDIRRKEEIEAETMLEWLNVYRDSAGYVLYLESDEKCVSGEQFRNAFLLPSSSFRAEKEKTQILFTIKGAGHGLGMSQFGANELAKEEKDYVEILKYFFQDAIITKIE